MRSVPALPLFFVLLSPLPAQSIQFKSDGSIDPSSLRRKALTILNEKRSGQKVLSLERGESRSHYRDLLSGQQKNPKNLSSDERFIDSALARFSPDSRYIVDRCAYPVMNWYRGKRGDRDALLTYLEVLVHECNHSLNSTAGSQIVARFENPPSTPLQGGGFMMQMPATCYLKGRDFIYVPLTETFPSKKISSMLPDSLKEPKMVSKLRIETYIDPASLNPSTQSQGIFGLLDEFDAYYHGMKAQFDIHRYYDTASHRKSRVDSIKTYLSFTWGNLYSGREFKIFILTYLLHAKKHEPKIYRELLDNAPFIEAFLSIDRDFERLVSDVLLYKEGVLKELSERGVSVKEQDDWIIIENSYVQNSFRAPDAYREALEQPELQAIMKELRKRSGYDPS